MNAGADHERAVAARLNQMGWLTAPFGQGMLTQESREILRDWNALIRWMPDLLVARHRTRHDDPTQDAIDGVRLVDAKWSERHDTPNYDFEKKSGEAHDRWRYGYSINVWLVFYDFRCCTVHEALASNLCRPGPDRGNGSGTPYWLLPKSAPFITDLVDAFRIGAR